MKQGLDYFDIYIPFQNRYRRVWVSLPPDYFRDSKEYPVLYLFDAQHTFGSETGAYVSDSKDWLFDEKLKDIFYQTGTGIIGVALEYDYSHPWDEFMPWDNKHMDNWLNDVPAVCPGNADLLLDFIVTILKPFIDDRYRTLEDRDNTGIGGGSRSALISLYAGLSHPETFSKVMALSPAVWLTEENSKPYLSGNNLKQWFRDYIVPKNVLFFLYIGGNENSGPPFPYPFAYAKDGTKLTMPQVYYLGADMVRKEMLTNLGDSSTFKFVYNINGTHFPYFWRRYIFDALNWLGFY